MPDSASSEAVAMRARGACCSVESDALLVETGFDLKDKRYDPLVGVVLRALYRMQSRTGALPGLTAIIAVTALGCRTHIARVAQALSEGGRPRQAIFARASATMLATYPALALSTHGPTFAVSGGADALRWAWAMAVALIERQQCEAAVLIAADTLDEPPQSRAAVLRVDPDHAAIDLSSWGDGPHLDALLPSAVLAAWLGRFDGARWLGDVGAEEIDWA
ncbi:hypothetical protein QHI69_37735 (plasmid) [Burkholderia gladioli pv. gladioli]|uniref:hypothetical protein n=1 Tax=Burkholderia gladioli TaxID=28095 RepID=UPI0019370DE1|nr:hypothetical protein [Burkholderia gladioli]MDJ1167663.1 hypothetical protein [Burkholderia gladioli pv. gladioli]QPQ88863.1 hypothetical protein I6H08_37960 [Burkholderia gladioli]